MRTPHFVANIPDGHIDRMILDLSGCDGSRGLVCTQDYWAEHRAVGIGILSNLVLRISVAQKKYKGALNVRNVPLLSMPNDLT